jgi:hypothetical protein
VDAAVPSDTPVLRPLGVGDVVDRVFTLYRARPVLFLALAAIPYLLLFLVIGALALGFASSFVDMASALGPFTGTRPATPTEGDFTRLAGIFGRLALFFIVAALAAIVLLSAQSASLIEAAAARYLGRPMTVGEAFGAGLAAAPRVIFAGIAVFVAIVGMWVVLAIVFVVARNGIVIGVGVIAGIVATFFLFASWLVAPVVATLERKGPIAALRRSWGLSSGHRWRILGLQILLAILQGVISTLISFVFVAAFVGDATVRIIAQNVVNVVATVAWAPVEWAAFTVFYFDLRVRKEAFDLQLAAEALPRQA